MHFFKYKRNELFAEDVPVKRLAEKYGTPLTYTVTNTSQALHGVSECI